MKKLALSVGILAVLFCLGGIAHAAQVTTLGFDDLTVLDPDFGSSVPNGYGEPSWVWSGINYITGDADPYSRGLVSSPNVAFIVPESPDMPRTMTLSTGGSEFNFLSACLTSGTLTEMAVYVTAKKDGNTVVGSIPYLINDNPTEIYFNLYDIDYLIIWAPADTAPFSFMMDDVAYSMDTPVPIPATLLLFGSGILGLFGIRRRLNR